MLANFTNFIEWIFGVLADFLASEPIIYLFYFVLAFVVVKMFCNLVNIFNN